jgi:hypothetical protein
MDKMKDYKQLIRELPSNTIVCAVGEFNPPTVGHELLVKTVKKLAEQKSSAHVIYTSPSKNSLIQEDKKEHYLNLMFPKTKFQSLNESKLQEVITELHKKYKKIILVVGTDQITEMRKLQNVELIPVDKDPEADNTKMKQFASKGIYENFKKRLPSTIRDIDGKRLMNEMRTGLGLEPIKEQIVFVKDKLREKYFRGEIFNEGDIVESHGEKFTIVKRGSNHLLLKESTGKLISKWIQDVKPTEEKEMNESKLTEAPIQPNGTDKIDTKTSEPTSNVGKFPQKTVKKGMITFYNYTKAQKIKEQHAMSDKKKDNESDHDYENQVKVTDIDQSEVGHTLVAAGGQDNLRRRKVKYHLGEEVKENPAAKELAKANLAAKHAKEKESLASKHEQEKESMKEAISSAQERGGADKHYGRKYNNPHNKGSQEHSDYHKGYHTTDSEKDYGSSRGKPLHKFESVTTESALERFRAASAEREKKHDEIERKRKEDAAQGKENMSGAIDRLEKTLNKEEVDHYQKAEEHKDDASSAKEAGDHFSYHMHMADHHGSLADWHYSKGRNEAGDKHAEKAADHEMTAHEMKEQVSTKKKPTVGPVATAKPFDPFFEEEELEERAKIRRKFINGKWIVDLKNTVDETYDQTIEVATPDTTLETSEENDVDDKEIEAMIGQLSDDDIMGEYDEDDLALVDDETGEEIPKSDEEDALDEQAIMEVLSRIERMKAKFRIRRTAAKRERATKIALKRYSNTATINKRARRLAIKLMKQRLLRGRDVSKLSVGEKERIERTLEQRKAVIGRIATRLVPRVRKVEKARMSHTKFTQGSQPSVF